MSEREFSMWLGDFTLSCCRSLLHDRLICFGVLSELKAMDEYLI